MQAPFGTVVTCTNNSPIPVFLVLIPLLINLGAQFDYLPGSIPGNVEHCAVVARIACDVTVFLDEIIGMIRKISCRGW